MHYKYFSHFSHFNSLILDHAVMLYFWLQPCSLSLVAIKIYIKFTLRTWTLFDYNYIILLLLMHSRCHSKCRIIHTHKVCVVTNVTFSAHYVCQNNIILHCLHFNVSCITVRVTKLYDYIMWLDPKLDVIRYTTFIISYVTGCRVTKSVAILNNFI